MIVIEQKEAADRLGVTARTIRDWRDQHSDFPDCSAGYDLDAITAWRDRLAKKGSEDGDAARKLKLARQAEALKRDRLRTRDAELDIAEREKELLPRPTWELFAANLLSGLADWCEQLPDLIAGQCCKKCQKTLGDRIKKELDRRREQLAEDLKRSSES